MTVRGLVLAAVAAATLAGTAKADDRIQVTPTLFREQARVTVAVHPASELMTTPSLTARATEPPRVVAEVTAISTR